MRRTIVSLAVVISSLVSLAACSGTLDAVKNSPSAAIHPEYDTEYDPIACSQSPYITPSGIPCAIAKMREEELAKFDVEGCKRRGGYVAGDGMDGFPSCRFDYSDGGKACRDHAECQGMCTLGFGLDPELESPTCTKDSRWGGCYSEVVDGVVQRAICYD